MKILHRVNTINYLKKVPKSLEQKLILDHLIIKLFEPLSNGIEWISFYEHDFNIKY